MSDQARYGIVIPVNHSVEDLRLCLESLRAVDYPRDRIRVVTVDCRHVPGLEEFAAGELPGFGLPVTHLVLPPRAPCALDWTQECRMNEARNAAVAACPAEIYVFVEDDTSFHADWLRKTDRWIDERTGALGGPDVLPPGLGSLAEALDVVLNSPLGSPGRGRKIPESEYCPRKDHLVIPARVLGAIGPFPEELLFSGEAEMARRIRAGGWDIRCMKDNPIWHRRVTTFPRFLQRNVHIAREKTRRLRAARCFGASAHALVLYAAVGAAALAVASAAWRPARVLFLAGLAAYALVVLAMGVRAMVLKHSVRAAVWVGALLPCHHASVTFGVISGLLGPTGNSADGCART